MSELALTVERPDQADELRGLAVRLIETEASLAEIRALLAELRRVAESRSVA